MLEKEEGEKVVWSRQSKEDMANRLRANAPSKQAEEERRRSSGPAHATLSSGRVPRGVPELVTKGKGRGAAG